MKAWLLDWCVWVDTVDVPSWALALAGVGAVVALSWACQWRQGRR